MKGLIFALFCLPLALLGQHVRKGFDATIDNRQYFIENKGQFVSSEFDGLQDSILFGYIGGKEKYFFTRQGVFMVSQEKKEKHNPLVFLEKTFLPDEALKEREREGEFLKTKQYSLYAHWNNTQHDLVVYPESKASHYYTFGKMNNKASAYKSITYKNIYPEIDIEYFIPGDSSGIKYNIILHPGADLGDLELEYLGDVNRIELAESGNIIVSTRSNQIGLTEHAPVSFYADNGNKIESSFYLTDKRKIKFALSGITEIEEKIVIDPWVSPIAAEPAALNYGYDVDYDASRNLYVYTIGLTANVDSYVSKYESSSGALLWTHAVTFISYPGNFLVEKNTGNIYISSGYEDVGSTIYRLNTNGTSDGFTSIANALAQEFWSLGFNCSTGTILALGGGTNSNLTGGIINTTTGVTSIENFTGYPSAGQDIVSFAIDNQGRLFTLYASVEPEVHNKIILVNSTLDGPVYNVPTGYNSFAELMNHVAFNMLLGSNQFNALAVNEDYLVYYDGTNLKAFNPDNGAALGSLTLPDHMDRLQGGVAIDDCSNVYVGGSNGNILYYNFDGTTFNFLGDLVLNWSGNSKNVFDIVFDRSTNQLFVSGIENVSLIESPVMNACNLLAVQGTCQAGGNGTATATLTTNASNAAITYIWKDAIGNIISQTVDTSALSNTINSLVTGTYFITAQINAPCGPEFADSVSIICNQCSLNAVATQVSCFGFDDGAATAFVEMGEAPFDFVWNSLPAQNSATATNLPPGNYSVTMTDNDGCSASADVTITEPPQLSATIIDPTNPLCFGDNSGSATAQATGGISPYNYSWNTLPIQNSALASNLGEGDYVVTITDANECEASASVSIIEPLELIASLSISSGILCFGENTGSISANASGGQAPYSYQWNTIPVQNTATANNLTAGNYNVIVTDDNGCEADSGITLSQPALLQVNINSSSTILCFGDNSGSATAIASGGSIPYSYSWNTNPVQNSPAVNNLSTGNYTISLSDNNGCEAAANINITEAALLTASITNSTNVACFGENTGSAIAAANGGTAPYSYIWNTLPIQNSALASDIGEGDYTVTITDANECEAIASVSIIEPLELIASLSISSGILCFGENTGSISANASGGQAPYSYQWNTIPVQNTATANNLTAGNYNIIVTDDNGCEAESDIILSQPVLLQVSISSASNILCFGENNGSATAIASGGSIPYSYLWNTNPVQNSATINNLPSGNYTINLSDNNGCEASANITITEAAPLTASIVNSTDVTCFSENTGSAIAAANGGTPPYSYTWNTQPIQNTNTASSLSAGQYIVNVLDANGCSASAEANISEPTQLNSSIIEISDNLCFGQNTGIATAFVSGGIGPYTCSWNSTPIQNTITAINLPEGSFTFTAEDANGCTVNSFVQINQPAQLEAIIAEATDVLCFGENNGSATVTASGGALPYSYIWNTTPQQTATTAINLSEGNYSVAVIDANSCTTNINVNIIEPESLSVSVTSQDVSCYGACDGQLLAAVQGGTLPYSLEWTSDGTNSEENGVILNDACAGNYNLVVYDANDCQSSSSTLVSEPVQVDISDIDTTPQLCADECTGSITITSANAISFSIDNGQTYQASGQFDQLCSGIYNIVVLGPNNCATNAEINIEQLSNPISDFDFSPTAPTTAYPLIEFNNLSQNATNYQWNFGGLNSSTEVNPEYMFPNNTPGDYTICLIATNANNCSDTHCETIIVEDEFCFYVPNTFTPTNDGINDYFMPVMQCRQPISYRFTVFNKWGELIYESNTPGEGWNGGYDTHYCQLDVYVWKVEIQMAAQANKLSYSGSVTLLR